MWHKVHPTIFRMGYLNKFPSKWFANNKREYIANLHGDLQIRDYILKSIEDWWISKIEVERVSKSNKIVVYIFTSKLWVIIGKQGANIDKLKKGLLKKFSCEVDIKVKEVKKPDLDASIIAGRIALQIEKRVPYKRVIKQTISSIMDRWAVGAKILVSGRLNGVEMARKEFVSQGKIPLNTIRADIDYCFKKALTPAGILGVKVWINRGLVFKGKRKKSE